MFHDNVVVTGDTAVKHANCLGSKAALATAVAVGPVAPTVGMSLRAKNKTEKATNKNNTGQHPDSWTADDATKRHDKLMWIAKPLQKAAPDGSWRVRYEPTKTGSWLKTRHQVVFRRKGGRSKGVPFQFAEATESDSVFKARVLDATRECCHGQGVQMDA